MSKPRVTERDREIAFNFRGSIADLPELLAAYREEVTGELVKALLKVEDCLDDWATGKPSRIIREAIAKAEGRDIRWKCREHATKDLCAAEPEECSDGFAEGREG